MIYVKVNKNLYNKDNLNELKKEYPLLNRLLACHRIINNELKTMLQDYPNIDIYLSTKKTQKKLGTLTNFRCRKEFKRKNKDPYIILYFFNIESHYTWHCVKGLKTVLYHEFGHFKQWLLNEQLGHNNYLTKVSNSKTLNNENLQTKNFLLNLKQ